MKKTITLVLFGVIIALVMTSCQSTAGQPSAPVAAPVVESPYTVVVNRELVENLPESLEDVLASTYYGQVLVAAELKDGLADIDAFFVKTARYAADPESVVEAIVVKEFSFGIVPKGTAVPEGYGAL